MNVHVNVHVKPIHTVTVLSGGERDGVGETQAKSSRQEPGS